jgi:dTDP-4-amino-4,6-dideoxygalactose transaminase
MIKHFGLDRQYLTIKDELLNATDLVLKSGRLLHGEYTEKLEKWLEHRTNSEYAILVHSGTQALEIIAQYIKYYYGPYSEDPLIIGIPDLTYIATLHAFTNSNICLSDDKLFNIELGDVDANGIVKYTSAQDFSCYVGLYGAPIERNISYFGDIVDGAQHWLIVNKREDIGLAMTVSFDPTKNLPASGNGGAIITNNDDLAIFAKNYRRNNITTTDHLTPTAGTNSIMSELDCSHVLVRANHIDHWQNRRKQIRLYYIDRFKNLPIRCLSEPFKVHADQKFVIYSEDKRDELANFLLRKKIEVRIHYEKPLSEIKRIETLNVKKLTFASTSAMLARSVLSLPIYPELSDYEIEYIASMVVAFYNQ